MATMIDQPMEVPSSVDVVIVGNGPSALILSFILHGHVPYYNASRPHPDPILHTKLSESPCLLDIDADELTAHFAASRLCYSTQALPVNVLLDTLVRPLADTDPGKYETCVEWRFEEEKAVSHIVLGNTADAGGQWADNPVSASWDIETLSYAEMLSLPGYSFEDHHRHRNGKLVPDFHRPTRREVADYLATYPHAVSIQDSIYTNVEVGEIFRTHEGFHIGSHNIVCKYIVLASGVFSRLIPPRPLLRPLSALPSANHTNEAPRLVVGSGFTAADVIISTPPRDKIIHIFKWDPENRPSPLRACHPRAYPEYAKIYRHMKLASMNIDTHNVTSPTRIRKSNPFFQDRDWDEVYEGLPNTHIKAIEMRNDHALLTLEASDGSILERTISGMDYVIGRRGSLDYLDKGLLEEIDISVGQPPPNYSLISGQTLRLNAERSIELAPGIFAIGSLTGDSLIRFAYGGCVSAAQQIMRPSQSRPGTMESSPTGSSASLSTAPSSPIDLHADFQDNCLRTGGHSDLHLDRSTRPKLIMEDTVADMQPA
jgi:hypothetical protein